MNYVETLENENIALQEKVEELQFIVDEYCDSKIFKKHYNVVPWWKFWVKKDENLHFYLKHTSYGPYGCGIKIKRKNIECLVDRIVTGKEDIWYQDITGGLGFLRRGVRLPVIQSFYKGHHIPMFDCDSEKDKFDITVHLEIVGLSYFVFQSSKGHYWIFVDSMTKSIKDAHRLVCEIKSGDQNHKDMTRKDKMFFLRACRKPQCSDDPRPIGHVGACSLCFLEFIEKISDYFEHSKEYKTLSKMIKG